jgi:hypothetical protein
MKKTILFFILMIMGIGVMACTGERRRATAGQIGCPAEEVTISDENMGWNTVTWTADCRGKRFFCTQVSGKDSRQVSCKEEIPK